MDKMGDTSGIPQNGIVYTGTRDDLQRKLRQRDDRITELEAALRKIAAPVAWMQSQLGPGERLDGGMAIALSNDARWLSREAEKALVSKD